MVAKRDYTQMAVEAARSVLLELVRILGEYRNEIDPVEREFLQRDAYERVNYLLTQLGIS